MVIPAREGLAEVAAPLEALLPEAEAMGVELVVVGLLGPDDEAPSEVVKLVSTDSSDMPELHKLGIEAARGEVVAVGEDHAVPRPGWCQAQIRAHAENGEAAVAGCLVNATDATLAGRANFLAFAAAWQPPMAELPSGRPPPASALSFKREALEGIDSQPAGWLEAELIPALFARRSMTADPRIVVDHHQDHGTLWSVRNAFHSARSSYGFRGRRLAPAERRELARWALARVAPQLYGEARGGAAGSAPLERMLVGAIVLAAALGAATGALLGPGRSPERVA